MHHERADANSADSSSSSSNLLYRVIYVVNSNFPIGRFGGTQPGIEPESIF